MFGIFEKKFKTTEIEFTQLTMYKSYEIYKNCTKIIYLNRHLDCQKFQQNVCRDNLTVIQCYKKIIYVFSTKIKYQKSTKRKRKEGH
jgi:hypothetical protein